MSTVPKMKEQDDNGNLMHTIQYVCCLNSITHAQWEIHYRLEIVHEINPPSKRDFLPFHSEHRARLDLRIIASLASLDSPE